MPVVLCYGSFNFQIKVITYKARVIHYMFRFLIEFKTILVVLIVFPKCGSGFLKLTVKFKGKNMALKTTTPPKNYATALNSSPPPLLLFPHFNPIPVAIIYTHSHTHKRRKLDLEGCRCH